LSQTWWYVLQTLKAGPKHGYAISQYLETQHDIRLGIGNLYTTLRRLLDQGLIEQLDGDDARRKVYKITALGSQVISLEQKRLEQMLRAVPRLAHANTGM